MLGQANPPMPSGYALLTSVTPAEQRWAYGIVHDPTTTYGDLFEATFNGVPVVAHVEHHTWTTDAAGNHIPGAYKGVTLYRPAGSMVPMSSGSGLKVIEVIVIGSAIFGAAFTVSKSYFEHQNARRAYEAPIREKVREKLLKARANPIDYRDNDLKIAIDTWLHQHWRNGHRMTPSLLNSDTQVYTRLQFRLIPKADKDALVVVVTKGGLWDYRDEFVSFIDRLGYTIRSSDIGRRRVYIYPKQQA